MYTIYNSTGEVYRDSDQKLIAPCDSVDDPDYIDYIAWVNQGNQPTVGNVSPTERVELQLAAWELIKTERDRRKVSGGYKVGNYWFHSDESSRIQQMALVMLGAGMPQNILWKSMSGDFVPMTPTLAQQIFQAAMISDMTLFAVAEQKRIEMQQLSDPRTYNHRIGWPPIYGE